MREALLQVRHSTDDCGLCPLHSTRTNLVFGEGVPHRGVMIIGEGPGEEEDLHGRPFIGRAGKLLDIMLDSAGFTGKANVYITNIVKCRPPKNRTPLPEERDACVPYLYEQIRVIEPKIIILLGATALQSLIDPMLRIGESRGKWLEWRGIQVLPTYHPAALLRNPNLKPAVWEDLKRVVDMYRLLVDSKHYCEYY